MGIKKTRDYILLYLNGERKIIKGPEAFLSLSNYLRYEQRLTGTKVVCSEGDCGACSVLQGFSFDQDLNFQTINSCITFVNLLDCSHLLTVEGLKKDGELCEIQKAMVDCHGTQCGFCTPGFVMALAGLFEKKDYFSEKHVRNYLTGNLCRCTGYKGIIEAALSLNSKDVESLKQRYHSEEILQDLREHQGQPVQIETEEKSFYAPTNYAQVAKLKQKKPQIRIFASATDLGVQINKERIDPSSSMSLNLIQAAHELKLIKGRIKVGARVSLTRLQEFMKEQIPEFDRFLNVFASPQIKNTATLIGNVANASPIGDTLPFLCVMNAEVEVLSHRGSRLINMNQFYKGYKTLNMESDEIITSLHIPLPKKEDYLKLYKVSKRKDLDISSVNAGFKLTLQERPNQHPQNLLIAEAALSFGGVGPTVLRFSTVEEFLRGKVWTQQLAEETALLIQKEVKALSDVRGTADYRALLCHNLFLKYFFEWELESIPGKEGAMVKDQAASGPSLGVRV